MRRLGPACIPPPRLARDPGLLAAECYPALERPDSSVMRVGICVTHPVALRYHADEEMPTATELTTWLSELVGAITKKGRGIFLFTTGSPEDEAYLDEVFPTLVTVTDRAGSASRVPRFPRAANMAGFISTLDLLVAHRLHACVAAYSYGVPHIGLTWDIKMRSFFEAVGRARFICGAVSTPANGIVSLAEEAIKLGISAEDRQSVMADTLGDIAELIGNLTDAPA